MDNIYIKRVSNLISWACFISLCFFGMCLVLFGLFVVEDNYPTKTPEQLGLKSEGVYTLTSADIDVNAWLQEDGAFPGDYVTKESPRLVRSRPQFIGWINEFWYSLDRDLLHTLWPGALFVMFVGGIANYIISGSIRLFPWRYKVAVETSES